jgi:hypothetical protein
MSRLQMPRDIDGKCRCGENRPEVMTGRGVCYECTLVQDGRKRTQHHHPFGRDNDIVTKIVVDGVPGNWHRALDSRRERRPEILKRPGDNPLQQIAAAVATIGEAADAFADFARRRGWPDWITKLADIFANAAGSAAEWLLILAGKLDEWRPGWVGEMPKWHP